MSQSVFFGPKDAAAFLNLSEKQLHDLVSPSFYPSVRNPRWTTSDLASLSKAGHESMIYVIRRPGAEVKIGISTNLVRRLRSLQSAHGQRLELLAYFPGDAADEAVLHERFKDCRMLGEWFEFTPEISAWIDDCQANPPRKSEAPVESPV